MRASPSCSACGEADVGDGGRGRDAHAPGDGFDREPVEAAGEALAVARVERGAQGGGVAGADGGGFDRDGDFEALAGVAHVDGDGGSDLRVGDVAFVQDGPAAGLQFLEHGGDRVPVECSERGDEAAGELDAAGGDEHADGGGDAGAAAGR